MSRRPPAGRECRTLPCPCGSGGTKIIVVGNDAGIHPQHGQIPWPVPSQVYCSVACATPAGWPWLRSEADRPRRAQGGR